MSQIVNLHEVKTGRFMIVQNVDKLDEMVEGLPDSVVAFAFRRMLREFRIGKALDDKEAARKLHRHTDSIRGYRWQYREFLELMDSASGHARQKILARKSAEIRPIIGPKSSEKDAPNPQGTSVPDCQTSEYRYRGSKKTPQESFLTTSKPPDADSISGVGSAPEAEVEKGKKEERLLSDEERAEKAEILRELVAKLRMNQTPELEIEERRPRPHYVVDRIEPIIRETPHV